MNAFIENYAQLIAVAAPVLTLAAMNLMLALGGERGTLLLPDTGLFETARRPVNTVPGTTAPVAPGEPANDPHYRHVA